MQRNDSLCTIYPNIFTSQRTLFLRRVKVWSISRQNRVYLRTMELRYSNVRYSVPTDRIQSSPRRFDPYPLPYDRTTIRILHGYSDTRFSGAYKFSAAADWSDSPGWIWKEGWGFWRVKGERILCIEVDTRRQKGRKEGRKEGRNEVRKGEETSVELREQSEEERRRRRRRRGRRHTRRKIQGWRDPTKSVRGCKNGVFAEETSSSSSEFFLSLSLSLSLSISPSPVFR